MTDIVNRLRTRNAQDYGFGLGIVCDEAAAEIERLQAKEDEWARMSQDEGKAEREIERLRKDAERYRWLRRGQHWSVIDGIGDILSADALDAAIDAAIRARTTDAST